ncbi:MAG: hypothetical protein ABR607_15945 [Pyrinomonadaceae bacterium]
MKIGRFIILFLLFANGESIANGSSFSHQIKDRMEVRLSDFITENDKLSYDGYLIRKHQRDVKMGEVGEDRRAILTDDEFAILSRRGRTLFRFDGTYGPIGNTTDFGLLSFLGPTRKELFVSQDIFRGGSQWVVSLGRSLV